MDLLQNMCHISEGFNPLISTIDRISPNNINTKSREQEKRERKI